MTCSIGNAILKRTSSFPQRTLEHDVDARLQPDIIQEQETFVLNGIRVSPVRVVMYKAFYHWITEVVCVTGVSTTN
jgi:hypothetical protein